jgi:hypothetical protein
MSTHDMFSIVDLFSTKTKQMKGFASNRDRGIEGLISSHRHLLSFSHLEADRTIPNNDPE